MLRRVAVAAALSAWVLAFATLLHGCEWNLAGYTESHKSRPGRTEEPRGRACWCAREPWARIQYALVLFTFAAPRRLLRSRRWVRIRLPRSHCRRRVALCSSPAPPSRKSDARIPSRLSSRCTCFSYSIFWPLTSEPSRVYDSPRQSAPLTRNFEPGAEVLLLLPSSVAAQAPVPYHLAADDLTAYELPRVTIFTPSQHRWFLFLRSCPFFGRGLLDAFAFLTNSQNARAGFVLPAGSRQSALLHVFSCLGMEISCNVT
jgi:hypothetical protein